MANRRAPAVISSVCRCSRNQIQRAVAFLINFLFRKHENSPLGKVHPAFRLLVFPSLSYPSRRTRGKKNVRNSLGWGDSRDDAGETNARRSKCAPGSSDGTDYFYDITSRARGCPRDEIPPSRHRVTNLHRERERSNPPRATDNDPPSRDRNTSRCLLFRVVLTLLLTATIDDSVN